MDHLPRIDMPATGANISRLMRERHITMGQLQETFGFHTPQAIYKWRRGQSLPTLDNLVILAEVFGTTMDAVVICTTPN